MNILASREVLSGQALEAFNKEVRRESIFFNSLKGEGKTSYRRHPSKVNGKWYIEQLTKTNSGFSIVKVLVHKVKSGKFTEQTSKLMSESIGNQLLSLGFRPSVN